MDEYEERYKYTGKGAKSIVKKFFIRIEYNYK